MKETSIVFLILIGTALLIFGLYKNEESQKRSRQAYETELREGPCSDQSELLATTAGSPSSFTCPNRLHEMQVQVATHPSSEEAAALVFCKCRRAEP